MQWGAGSVETFQSFVLNANAKHALVSLPFSSSIS
jgi:hypothetical protein